MAWAACYSGGMWPNDDETPQTESARFLPGLPGTGPLPVHLHTGQPTPWSEGIVVEFQLQCGESWIGNLQRGYGYATKIIDWPEAGAVIVIAKGASYFVRANSPTDWKFYDLLGVDCLFSPMREIAVLTTYNDVVAIALDGAEKWRRVVACDGVKINCIDSDKISGIGGIDPPDEWHPFVLSLADGSDWHGKSAP